MLLRRPPQDGSSAWPVRGPVTASETVRCRRRRLKRGAGVPQRSRRASPEPSRPGGSDASVQFQVINANRPGPPGHVRPGRGTGVPNGGAAVVPDTLSHGTGPPRQAVIGTEETSPCRARQAESGCAPVLMRPPAKQGNRCRQGALGVGRAFSQTIPKSHGNHESLGSPGSPGVSGVKAREQRPDFCLDSRDSRTSPRLSTTSAAAWRRW